MNSIHTGDSSLDGDAPLRAQDAVERALVRELGDVKAKTELGHSSRHEDMDMWHLDQRML